MKLINAENEDKNLGVAKIRTMPVKGNNRVNSDITIVQTESSINWYLPMLWGVGSINLELSVIEMSSQG